MKKKIVGHWGTVPGQNFVYVHLNRVIKQYDQDMVLISGPGHGGNFFVANAYLDGTYSEVYPNISRDEEGMKKLFKQFSFPGGISSHVAPETPGSINEGGELGYSIAHAFGAAFDNPDLIVACTVGDGEAETGPLATSWQSNKFLNPVGDGAVLPILHLNGYKISNPTVFGRMTHEEIESFFKGCSWKPYFVEGDDPMTMHEKMADTLDTVINEIHDIQKRARSGEKLEHIQWPMIVLRTPKGWTGPKVVDGKPIEGTFRAHQVPIDITLGTPHQEEHLKQIEEWLHSYHPEELFDENGTLIPELQELAPTGDRRIAANPHANGGKLLRDLRTPDFKQYAVDIPFPGSVEKQDMLCVTNDGRKIGLDVRLMNPMLPDDPNSKLNTCVRNVLQIWEDGKEQKLTQLLFCDLSTPKNDGNFNVYDDIRKKLVAAGVPESEVEFIHNADTEAKKAALFSKVRSGDVRILLGSTAKMGAGTNVQQRLVAVHHLDVGWKPSDMTQRNGRIIRQGNMNKEIKVFNYVTEGTFDSYLFQTLENKQRFISQIMTSKSPVRSCDDVDEQALSYAEIKALCAGNPLIKEKMDLDVQVAKMKVLKADHQSQKFRLEDKLLTKFPADIQETTTYIAGVKSDAELAAAHPQAQEGFCGITIKGVTYGVSKLDSIVEEVVRQIFAQFREVSRKKLLESVKTNDAARIQKKIKKIQKDLESKQKELDDLKAETILVIRGVSALDKELLGTLVAEAKDALETLEKQLGQAQEEYDEATKTAKRSNYICNELFTWADVYDTANHDERRAILQQFIKEIRVRKDYEISITLNASFNQVEQFKSVSTYDGAEIFEEISERRA